MRIGILTFHSQQNYGGVLQCWALQTALEQMGHEVKVIDRWFDPKNSALFGIRGSRSPKEWGIVLLRTFTGQGGGASIRRSVRFERFIRDYLKLTDYHFCDWKEAPLDLKVDLIIVGSDQVWHGGDWGWPEVYLLEGAPDVPAIAYAASFGMREVPVAMMDLYRRGIAKFSAISVRETEGQRLVTSLGGKSTVVVDPTLLVDSKCWQRLLRSPRRSDLRKLMVYFIGEGDLESMIPQLEKLASFSDYSVEVFLDGYLTAARVNPLWIMRHLASRFRSSVRIRESAGPIEFVRAIAESECVLTNSFHAVMFSSIFSRQVKVVAPQSGSRKKMFARIEEFVKRCTKGKVIAESVQDALVEIGNGAKMSYNMKEIAMLQAQSRDWLTHAVAR